MPTNPVHATSVKDITIRNATAEDIQTLQELNQQLVLFECQFSDNFNIEWPLSDQAKDYFTRLVEKGIVKLAYSSDDQPVGYICGAAYNNFHTLKNPNVAQIDHIVVDEMYRGRGIGRNLTDAFEQEARKRGATLVKVSALYKNPTALAFYRKMGMTEKLISFERKL